jgi:hypothetical protein
MRSGSSQVTTGKMPRVIDRDNRFAAACASPSGRKGAPLAPAGFFGGAAVAAG